MVILSLHHYLGNDNEIQEVYILSFLTDTQFIRNKILPVADKYRDITFAIANEEEFDEEIKSLGLEDSGESVNVGIFADKLK